MKQVILELPDETAAELELAAPGRALHPTRTLPRLTRFLGWALALIAAGCLRVESNELTWANASMKALEQGRCVESQQALQPVSPEDRQDIWYELAAATARSCRVEGNSSGVYEWGVAALSENENRFPSDPRRKLRTAKLLEDGGDSLAAANKYREAQALAEEILRTSVDADLRAGAQRVLNEISAK